MAKHMRAKRVNDALLMAVWKRKPDKGSVWHTDRQPIRIKQSSRTDTATWHHPEHEPQRQLPG